MKELNETQRKMYEYLAEQAQKGIVPSVREIGEHVGLKSTGSVQRYLERLEEAGYIERDSMRSRSIRVKGEKQPTVQVPLIGTVTAGMPILAYESIEGYVPFMGSVTSEKSLFIPEGSIQILIISGSAAISCAVLPSFGRKKYIVPLSESPRPTA